MKPGPRGSHRVRLALLPALVGAGCGANLQAVYESDVRFEHCMALDLEPTVRDVVRLGCWSEWLEHETYGQTRDRIAHAEGRLEALRHR